MTTATRGERTPRLTTESLRLPKISNFHRKTARDAIMLLLPALAKTKKRYEAVSIIETTRPSRNNITGTRQYGEAFWRLERNLIVGRLFNQVIPKYQLASAAAVRFTIGHSLIYPWALGIRCNWCKGNVLKGGCMMCLSHHNEKRGVMDSGEYGIWHDSIIDDPRDALIFADRLDDRNHNELAALFRAEGERLTET